MGNFSYLNEGVGLSKKETIFLLSFRGHFIILPPLPYVFNVQRTYIAKYLKRKSKIIKYEKI